ncbi:MAG: glycosyltransferase [Deltaproteobacteria bacterium]|nr:glycosyltransferase [Deltaproteobacteria bacterium]
MSLASALDLGLALAALPLLAACLYLGLLTLCSGRRAPAAAAPPPTSRFEVLVPAHDEEDGIGRTVASILTGDYPAPLRRVTVVADNCSDATAARARAAGARVLVRTDPAHGKGRALAFGLGQVLEERFADAVVVVDADTVASPGLLRAYAARLERGAAAVQADNGVLNPGDSWRTRLMAIALGSFHRLRFGARERLGLSCGLRGNGMCLSRRLLLAVPHTASSRAEDLEYGLLVAEAGHRVHYAAEGHVLSAMVSGEAPARSQRRRWEEGRGELARLHGRRLLALALARRDLRLLDVALDLLVPPLATLAAWAAGGLGVSALVSIAWHPVPVALLLWAGCVALLAAYVLRGWVLSETGWRGLQDLLVHAPAYAVWKVALRWRAPAPGAGGWVRTPRE